SRDRRAEARYISPEIGTSVNAQREEVAVAVERELGARDMVAALRIGEKRFGAPRDPFHRALQPACRPDEQRLLGVVLALVAEAAAHVARHDAQLAFVQAELFANIAADVVRRLRAAVERIAGGD